MEDPPFHHSGHDVRDSAREGSQVARRSCMPATLRTMLRGEGAPALLPRGPQHPPRPGVAGGGRWERSGSISARQTSVMSSMPTRPASPETGRWRKWPRLMSMAIPRIDSPLLGGTSAQLTGARGCGHSQPAAVVPRDRPLLRRRTRGGTALQARRIAGLRPVQVGSSAAARLSDSHRLKSAVLQLR